MRNIVFSCVIQGSSYSVMLNIWFLGKRGRYLTRKDVNLPLVLLKSYHSNKKNSLLVQI